MQVDGVVNAVTVPRVNMGVTEKRSTLPIHPLLTTSSAFELTGLLAKLRRQPEVREELIQKATRKHKLGMYSTRQAAQQTAHAVLNE